MSTLVDCLNQLFELLHRRGLDPPVQEVRIFEKGIHVAMDDKHQLIISRDALTTPEEYADRFEELTHSGLAWINIVCYGVYEKYLFLAIELPDPRFQIQERNHQVVTSVNYSWS